MNKTDKEIKLIQEAFLGKPTDRAKECPCKRSFHNNSVCGETGKNCVAECLLNRTDIKYCGCGWDSKTGVRYCDEHTPEQRECRHDDGAICWNEFNKVIQCHKCGEIFISKKELRGILPKKEKIGYDNFLTKEENIREAIGSACFNRAISQVEQNINKLSEEVRE